MLAIAARTDYRFKPAVVAQVRLVRPIEVTATSPLHRSADLDCFQRLVADARASTTQGQFERAASLLRDALALWRGPPLCDVASETLRRMHRKRPQLTAM